MPEVDVLDVRFQDTPGAIACHWVAGAEVIVDPGPESCSGALLDALGDRVPRAILLTHIHLDHAGATGALLARWPETEVWVHERGARHLHDPSRLIASATRIYGDQMERLWGAIVPVPQERLRVLSGGESLEGFRVEYLPGHAVHHVGYLHEDSGVAFVGDVGGVRVGDGPTLAPTPPPDIDVEDWHRSLTTVGAWRPSALAITHFGMFTDVEAQLEAAGGALDAAATLARDVDEAEFERRVRAQIGGDASYLKASPPETLYAGLDRYWSKRAEADNLPSA